MASLKEGNLHEEALLQSIDTLSKKRWKAGLLIEDERGAFDQMWQAHPAPLVERIDLIEELLVEILNRSDVVLGAFHREDFLAWLTERVQRSTAQKALICTQFDAWLSTCRKTDGLAFFSHYATRDYSIPVIIVTSQRKLVKSSNFPSERLWSVRDMEAV